MTLKSKMRYREKKIENNKISFVMKNSNQNRQDKAVLEKSILNLPLT